MKTDKNFDFILLFRESLKVKEIEACVPNGFPFKRERPPISGFRRERERERERVRERERERKTTKFSFSCCISYTEFVPKVVGLARMEDGGGRERQEESGFSRARF